MPPRSTRGGGSGLGLAITKKFFDVQGADIAVNSDIGAGSTFLITFPHNAAQLARAHGRESVVAEFQA